MNDETPLKPRIDFARPLESNVEKPLRVAQTFDATGEGAFLALREEEPQEEGAGEKAVEAALRPRRSLWRKRVGAGLARCARARGR